MPDPLWRFKNPERFALLSRRSWHKRKERILAERKRQADERQQWLNSLKIAPCTDCKLKFPYYVMEWDHCRGKRKYSISEMRAHSIAAIQKELAKCDLVCANCHRVRTWTRKQQGASGVGRPRGDSPVVPVIRSKSEKLTDADIATIRALRSKGALLREIATRFGVGTAHVSEIVNHKTRITPKGEQETEE